MKSQLTQQGARLSVTETQYEADTGRVKKTIDAAGQPATFEYDKRGLQTAVINALNQRSETRYDAAGRTIATKDPLGRETKTTYDDAGRPIKVTFADGTFVTTAYDNRGRKTAETDQLGQTTNYEYDARGRLTAVVLPAVSDPELNPPASVRPRYEYLYDLYGNLRIERTKVRQFPNGTIDRSAARETRFTYDQFGRQLSRILPGGATETWQFNTLGQLTKHTDFKGQREESAYDAFGRLDSRQWFATGSTTPGDSVTYHYDVLGRMDSYVDSRGTTSYAFDRDGRTTQIVSPEGTINYAYDPSTGRHTGTWTTNSGIGYGYDELGRLKTVSLNKRDGTTLGSPETTTYSYTAAGSLASVSHPNGVTSNYTYDQLYRLLTIEHRNASNVLVAGYSYTRRADGRIIQVVESDSGGDVSTTDYVFEELGRLKSETFDDLVGTSGYETIYTHDLVGNRLKKETAFETAALERIESEYNLRDWLTTERTYVNNSLTNTATAGYDANGSLTSRDVTTGDDASYVWSLRNWLASAAVGSNSTGYVYNDDGIQVRRTENGTTRLYLLDPNNPTGYVQVIEEYSAGGVLLASFVYGMEPLSQSQGGTVSHYLMDAIAVRLLLNAAAAAVLNRYRFDAYGNLLAQTGTAVNSVLYRGERFDPILGQYYLRARFYDPATGRFAKVDPFQGHRASPATLHKYLYAVNDPLTYLDRSGLDITIAGINVSAAFRGALSALKTAATWIARAYAKTVAFFASAMAAIRQGWHQFTRWLSSAPEWIGNLPSRVWEWIRNVLPAAGRNPPTEAQSAAQGFATRGQLHAFWERFHGWWSSNGNLQVHHFVEQGGLNARNFLA